MASMDDVLFSSAREDWGTPRWVFDALNEVFHFELDAAASDDNALCTRYFTAEDSGLNVPWCGPTFVNPPYSRKANKLWGTAISEHMAVPGARIVALVAGRTATTWYHQILNACDYVVFIRGRLRFVGATSGAPFPSHLMIKGPLSAAQLPALEKMGVVMRKYCDVKKSG